MRFLFTVHPMVGHFHSMVPLALALKKHGHEVIFATGAKFAPVIHRAGFQHFPCGISFDGTTDFFEALPEWEAIKAKMPSDKALQQIYGFIQGFAPKMIEDLLELIATWKPDVVIRDPAEFGGYIIAEHCAVPHATISWSTFIPAKFMCADALLELRQRYQLPDDPELDTLDQYLVLAFMPPSWIYLYSPVPHVTHRFCAPPFDLSGDEKLPDWVRRLPDRPTVYATLGTTFNQSPETFHAILTALGSEDLNLIVTVGRSVDTSQFKPQADNVRIEQYIPQTLILPHCDAVLFHGGYNSLHSALWHGLPMVMTPLGAPDQLASAYQCVEHGVAVLVEEQPPTPQAIRLAVRNALQQPSYRVRAQQMQCEIKRLPSLAEAVKSLEILARTREPLLTTFAQ